MKKAKLISLFLSAGICANAQSISPKITPSSGGYYTGGNKSLSWTMGETHVQTFIGGSKMLTEGFQQPEQEILNLTAFFDGYYLGSRLMQPVLFNEGVDLNPSSTNTDTVLVDLYDPSNTSLVVASFKGVLQTDGTLRCTYPGATIGHSYYIAVKHRSAVQTWSAAPVALSQIISYDFTTAKTKAYGNNMIQAESGVWAFYNGDLNQDENIDLLDFPDLNFGIVNGRFGYFNSDLNGDGNVDILDYPTLNFGIVNGIFSNHP